MRELYLIVADVLAQREIPAGEAYAAIRMLTSFEQTQTAAIQLFCELILTGQKPREYLSTANDALRMLDMIAQAREADPEKWLNVPIPSRELEHGEMK